MVAVSVDPGFGSQGERDVRALQDLLEAAPGYALRVTGRPPGPADAREALEALPPGLAPTAKVGFALREGSELIAFADVLHGWPRPETAHIGLLVVREDRRGSGYGRQLHGVVVAAATAWGDVRRLRLGIVATNAEVAEPFWIALGYRPTGETAPYSAGDVVSSTAIWERDLA